MALLPVAAAIAEVGTAEACLTLLDNDSAYEPLLAYYRETPHTVVMFLQPCMLLFLVLKTIANLSPPTWAAAAVERQARPKPSRSEE